MKKYYTYRDKNGILHELHENKSTITHNEINEIRSGANKLSLLFARIWLPIVLSFVIYFVFDVSFIPTFIVCLVLNIVNNIRLRKKNR